MKKILAILLILVMISVPMLAVAAAPKTGPRITAATYDGEMISGETTAKTGTYWARCTVFLRGGTYFVVSLPIYNNGTFGLYLAVADVLGIGVEIRAQPGTSPGGAVYDFKPAELI